ncbi:MAG: 5-oxoprolinase subunit PxpB [Akkermansiaceae bacterium]
MNSDFLTTIPCRSFRYGSDAWMIEFAAEISDRAWETAAVIRKQLETRPPEHLIESTFSYTRVLLEFELGNCPDEAPSFSWLSLPIHMPNIKVIDVCYDGLDLRRVSEFCGLTESEVIRLHSEPIYRVHFLGFAPGFPYMSGLSQRLFTPRLDTPRVCIPAGSVGIGGEQTGIYPLPTPGGWNLIGRIREKLFDPSAPQDQCTLFKAGDRIQFRPVTSFDR